MSIFSNRNLKMDFLRGSAALSVALTHWITYFPREISSENMIYQIWNRIINGSIYLFSHTFWANNLDGIVAILPDTDWINNGTHPGVTLFIVLSGYCIHYPQAKNPTQINSNNFWKNFFIRRWFRIWPPFFIALVFGYIVYFIKLYSTGIEVDTTGISLNFLLSIFSIAGWVPAKFPFGNDVLATVMVEMWLYAIYPLTLLLSRKIGWLPLLLLTFNLYCFSYIFLFSPEYPYWLQNSIYTFYIYWVIGAYTAEQVIKRNSSSTFLPILIFIGYIIFCHLVDLGLLSPLKNVLFSVVIGLFLTDYLSKKHENKKKIFKFISTIGISSYSLYIVHVPIFVIIFGTIKIFDLSNTPFVQIAALFIVFTAMLFSYIFIERPSHQYARKNKLHHSGSRD